MADTQTGEISFKVSGLPKMPSMPKPELPKGNIELLQGRAEKYFAKKPFLILNFLSCWATVVLSAVTVWYVTSMNSLPSLPSLTLPRFRHGDAHAAQAQMQIDSASEQHDLQFFLIMIVLFAAPLAIMGAAEAQRALTNGDQLATADAASAQSSAALVKVLQMGGLIIWIVGQVFYYRCLPTGTCYDAPYKIVAAVWIYWIYATIANGLLALLFVACCVKEGEEDAPLLGEEAKEE